MSAQIPQPDGAGEMRVFVAVAHEGSMSAAGRRLGLTPSAISRTIARLEARLGTRLIIRTTRSISITAEGQTYLQAASRILADIAEVEDAITDQGVPRGRLRVSAALAHGRVAILPVVGRFCAAYPQVHVDLILSDQLIDVLGGKADVAIRFGALTDSPLTARRLGETAHVIVASPEYLARQGTPRVPEDLLKHNCLDFNFRRAAAGWPFKRDAQLFTLDVTGTVSANTGEALSQLARLGVGIARESIFTVQEDLESGRLVPLLEEYNPHDCEPFHAVFVGGSAMPARVRAFVDFLVDWFH